VAAGLGSALSLVIFMQKFFTFLYLTVTTDVVRPLAKNEFTTYNKKNYVGGDSISSIFEFVKSLAIWHQQTLLLQPTDVVDCQLP